MGGERDQRKAAVAVAVRSGMRWAVRHGAVRAALWRAARRGDTATLLIGHPDLRTNPYPLYDDIRSRGTFVAGRLATVTADHRAATAVLRSDAFGASVDPAGLPLPLRALAAVSRDPRAGGPVDPPSLLAVDPPDHTRYRRLVSRVFTARAIEGLRGRVEETADGLLDALAGADADRVDLIESYATLLPVTVIAEILGVPPDMHAQFLVWGSAAAPTLDTGLPFRAFRQVEHAQREINTWLRGHFARLRRDPGDDLLSRLVVGDPAADGSNGSNGSNGPNGPYGPGRTGGGGLTETELTATAQLLLAAGFETTVNLLGTGTALLMAHPDQAAHLREDPGGWPNAVEEILRYDAPVQLTARFARTDSTVLGTPIRAGRPVVTLLGGTGRDPALFTDPNVFDVRRANAREHLAFSSGIHYCLGAALARMEGEVGLRRLFERHPDLAPAGPPRRRPTRVLRGYASLPVSLRGHRSG